MQNAPIILLKDGADTSQGRGQVISNINACQVVVDIVKTTLGMCDALARRSAFPRGLKISTAQNKCPAAQGPAGWTS